MPHRLSRYVRIVVAVCAVAWGFLFARYLLATQFLTYDDEGYFLLRLSRYLRLGPVAAGTYTPYGPFFDFVQQACFGLLGLPVSHDSGRLVTLLCWMAYALLGGAFVYRISRSALLGAAAALTCIRVTYTLAQEPGHPQQVVVVLFALACCLSASRVSGRILFLLGAVGAALAFTKINIGAFYLAAFAFAIVCLLPASRVRFACIALLVAYALIAPPALTYARLWNGAGGFALVAGLCAAATFTWGARGTPDTPVPLRLLGSAAAGALTGTLLIVAATMWQGVSPAALVDGIVLEPARHPAGLLFLGFRLGVVPCLATIATLAGIAAIAWWRERRMPLHEWFGTVRIAIGLGVVFLLVRTDLSWTVAFLPLGVIPIASRQWTRDEWFTRLFISALAATQFLSTYPVAGGQSGIASVPVLLWGFVCLSDGIEDLQPAPRWWSRALWRDVAGVLVIVAVAAGMWRSGLRQLEFADRPSSLRGAATLHLPREQESAYRSLAGSIELNCSLLYTLPRLHSLNLWSGIAPPAGSETPLSFPLYSAQRQQQVLAQLQANPWSCAIYHHDLLEFYQPNPEELARSPLANYVIHDMPKVAEFSGYEIHVNPNRNSPWVTYPLPLLKLRGIAGH